jgi:hypothetical protein
LQHECSVWNWWRTSDVCDVLCAIIDSGWRQIGLLPRCKNTLQTHSTHRRWCRSRYWCRQSISRRLYWVIRNKQLDVSGPIAWFIMKNESRFLFSHNHAYAAFDGLLGCSIPSQFVNITFINRRTWTLELV